MSKLENKVAVITGGNSGIGFGIAKAFKNEGAKGVIVGRNQETLDSSVAQLGDNFIAINADVTNLADLERVFKETSEKFGKIDVVVANAGGGTIGTVADIGEMFIELLGLDPTKPYPRDLESRLDMSQSFVRTAVESDFRMRSGCANKTIAEWLDFMQEFSLEGLEKNITCPLLILAGESEFDPARMEKEKIQWKKAMNHPKSQVKIGKTSEGGEGHSMINNLLLKNQIEFDWLDDVLDWKS